MEDSFGGAKPKVKTPRHNGHALPESSSGTDENPSQQQLCRQTEDELEFIDNHFQDKASRRTVETCINGDGHLDRRNIPLTDELIRNFTKEISPVESQGQKCSNQSPSFRHETNGNMRTEEDVVCRKKRRELTSKDKWKISGYALRDYFSTKFGSKLTTGLGGKEIPSRSLLASTGKENVLPHNIGLPKHKEEKCGVNGSLNGIRTSEGDILLNKSNTASSSINHYKALNPGLKMKALSSTDRNKPKKSKKEIIENSSSTSPPQETDSGSLSSDWPTNSKLTNQDILTTICECNSCDWSNGVMVGRTCTCDWSFKSHDRDNPERGNRKSKKCQKSSSVDVVVPALNGKSSPRLRKGGRKGERHSSKKALVGILDDDLKSSSDTENDGSRPSLCVNRRRKKPCSKHSAPSVQAVDYATGPGDLRPTRRMDLLSRPPHGQQGSSQKEQKKSTKGRGDVLSELKYALPYLPERLRNRLQSSASDTENTKPSFQRNNSTTSDTRATDNVTDSDSKFKHGTKTALGKIRGLCNITGSDLNKKRGAHNTSDVGNEDVCSTQGSPVNMKRNTRDSLVVENEDLCNKVNKDLNLSYGFRDDGELSNTKKGFCDSSRTGIVPLEKERVTHNHETGRVKCDRELSARPTVENKWSTKYMLSGQNNLDKSRTHLLEDQNELDKTDCDDLFNNTYNITELSSGELDTSCRTNNTDVAPRSRRCSVNDKGKLRGFTETAQNNTEKPTSGVQFRLNENGTWTMTNSGETLHNDLEDAGQVQGQIQGQYHSRRYQPSPWRRGGHTDWVDEDLLKLEASLEDPFNLRGDNLVMDESSPKGNYSDGEVIEDINSYMRICEGLEDLVKDIDTPFIAGLDSDRDDRMERTRGSTMEYTSGRSVYPTRGRTVDDARGRTVDDTRGRTVDDARGGTVDDTRGRTMDDTRGRTMDDTRGRTMDDTRGRTMDDTRWRTNEQTTDHTRENTFDHTRRRSLDHTRGRSLDHTRGSNNRNGPVGNQSEIESVPFSTRALEECVPLSTQALRENVPGLDQSDRDNFLSGLHLLDGPVTVTPENWDVPVAKDDSGSSTVSDWSQFDDLMGRRVSQCLPVDDAWPSFMWMDEGEEEVPSFDGWGQSSTLNDFLPTRSEVSPYSSFEADDEFECECDFCNGFRQPSIVGMVEGDTGTQGSMMPADLVHRCDRLRDEYRRLSHQYGYEISEPTSLDITESNTDLGFGVMFENTILQLLANNMIQHMVSVQPDLLSSPAPPPANQAVIDNIPTVHLSQDDIEQNPVCPVCLCPFMVDEAMSRLPCQHIFHPLCIQAWLAKSGTCPLCRYRIGE